MTNAPHAVRAVLRDAATRLREAGVASPDADARTLLAYVCGIEPARIPLLDGLDDEAVAAFEGLVTSRAARVPLQHLTGRAYFRHVELEVGPGVFVPRPETAVMTGWAGDALRPMVAAGRAWWSCAAAPVRSPRRSPPS
jgi:release factor glutamine methyltransferase